MTRLCKVKAKTFAWIYCGLFVSFYLGQALFNHLLAAQVQTISQPVMQIDVSGTGKPVILIPGLMSDGRVWQSLVIPLSKHYQVHVVNIAGFGDTPAIEQPSLQNVADELLAYIKQQQLKQPAIVGHSLGGFLSFWLASHAPKSIGPIISVDGLPFIGPILTGSNQATVETLAGQAKQTEQMFNAMSKAQLEDYAKMGLTLQATSDQAKQDVLQMIKHSDAKTVGQAMAFLMGHDLRQDIANIQSPVLLLGASGGFSTQEQHNYVHQLYTEQLKAAPQAKVKMNTFSRHFIMFDDPNWLTEQVMHFLGAQL